MEGIRLNIVVYSTPNCAMCRYTKKQFDTLGLSYQDIDITQDEDAAKDVRRILQTLGSNLLPVVVTDNETWSGFRINKIRALGTS